MKRILVVALLALGPSFEAQAHAHLDSAVPADGSVVTTPPGKLSLSFSDEVRLTALTVQGADGKSQPVKVSPADSARTHSLAAPQLAPGKYTVSWRAMGADNHVMSGTYHFTVASPGS